MIRKSGLTALAVFALLPAAPATAQIPEATTRPALVGTRLDIAATGEVSRVPTSSG